MSWDGDAAHDFWRNSKQAPIVQGICMNVKEDEVCSRELSPDDLFEMEEKHLHPSIRGKGLHYHWRDQVKKPGI